MTYTPKSIMGKRFAERLTPWLTDDLARYADAAGQPFQPVLEVAEEEGTQGEPGWVPGWGKLLNPTTCPAKLLPYLAMYVGVQIPVTADETNARALVKAQAGRERGTLGAIEAEATRTAPPGATFLILERTNPKGEEDAYQMVIAISGIAKVTWEEATGTWEEGVGSWASESPIYQMRTAVEAVKPVIRINWLVSEGATWFDDEGTWEETEGTWAESVLPGGKL